MRKCIYLLILIVFAFSSITGCEKSEQTTQKTTEKKVEKKQVKQGEKTKGVWVKISEDDKQYLMKVARKSFDLWVKEKKRYKAPDVPAHLKDMKSNLVFATIYKEGDWRGCVAARGNNVVESVVGSVINTCKDKRFKDPEPGEIDKFRVEVSILQPQERIDTKDPVQIQKELEPGVHGIVVINSNGKRAFFLPYVFVKKQRTTLTWLQRLSRKAGLPSNGWKSPEATIYRYNTINFIEDAPYGKAVDLYRYKVELDEFSFDDVSSALSMGTKWYKDRRLEAFNRFSAGHDTSNNKVKHEDNNKLQLIGMTGLGYAADIAKDLESINQVRWGMKGIEKSLKKEGKNLKYVEGEADDIEGTLLLADLLGTTGAVKDRRTMVPKVLGYLKSVLTDDVEMPESGNYISDLPNYSVFVIARLAKFTKDKKNIEYAKKFYAKHWKPNKAWSLLAVAAAAQSFDDPAYIKKTVEVVKKVMKTQYTKQTAPYSDYIGAFSTEKIPTTVGVADAVRGLALAYDVTSRESSELQSQLLNSLIFGTRWLLEQQLTPKSAFYIKDYGHFVGTFKRDMLVSTSRLDDTSRALLALTDVKRYAEKYMTESLNLKKVDLVK